MVSSACGQAANVNLNKIVTLQKHVIRLMYFLDHKSHCAPLFVTSRILPMKMLFFKSVASLLHDIGDHCAPPNISALFTRSKHIHAHFTRSPAAGNFYIKRSRINKQLPSVSRISLKIWNGTLLELCEQRKALFTRKLNDILLQILKNEEFNADMRYIKLSNHI